MRIGKFYCALIVITLGLPFPAPGAASAPNPDDRDTRKSAETRTKASDPAPREKQSLASFKIIQERNIFNPNRYGRSGNSERRQPTTRSTPSDTLTLTGTIEYEKGIFAFFDGSSSGYRKVLKAGETFGDFKVVAVGPEVVRLTQGTNEFELSVGTLMRKEDSGEWKVAGRVEFASSSPSAITSTFRSGTPSAGPSTSREPQAGFDNSMMPAGEAGGPGGPFGEGGPGGPFGEAGPSPEGVSQPQNNTATTPVPSTGNASTDEVLRRLAQRREQEMSQ